MLVYQLGDFGVVGLGEFGLNHVNGYDYQAQMRGGWRADLLERNRLLPSGRRSLLDSISTNQLTFFRKKITSILERMGEAIMTAPASGGAEGARIHHPAIWPDFLRAIARETGGRFAEGRDRIDNKRGQSNEAQWDRERDAASPRCLSSGIDEIEVAYFLIRADIEGTECLQFKGR